LLGFLTISAHPALASMIYCNKTKNPIEAAIGYRQSEDWVSEGWWRIESGQCARVMGQPLLERFYYYYARSLSPAAKGKAPFVWGGKYQFCIDTKAFKFEGDGDCEGKGFITKGFEQIDIGGKAKKYSLDFKDGSEGR
jgi:uncharacterized membrane protein